VEWWQIILIVAGAVVAGLVVGYLLNLLFSRIASRPKAVSVVPPHQPASPSEPRPTQPSVPDLYAEIDYNRRLATTEWSGQLQPFQTRAWDGRGDEIHSLAVDVRNELAEAYSDMALANSITWLSTEMERRSPSLDESYEKLRSSVATRLNHVRLLIGDHSSPTKSGSIK
jgi:hypothetical protein